MLFVCHHCTHVFNTLFPQMQLLYYVYPIVCRQEYQFICHPCNGSRRPIHSIPCLYLGLSLCFLIQHGSNTPGNSSKYYWSAVHSGHTACPSRTHASAGCRCSAAIFRASGVGASVPPFARSSLSPPLVKKGCRCPHQFWQRSRRSINTRRRGGCMS